MQRRDVGARAQGGRERDPPVAAGVPAGLAEPQRDRRLGGLHVPGEPTTTRPAPRSPRGSRRTPRPPRSGRAAERDELVCPSLTNAARTTRGSDGAGSGRHATSYSPTGRPTSPPPVNAVTAARPARPSTVAPGGASTWRTPARTIVSTPTATGTRATDDLVDGQRVRARRDREVELPRVQLVAGRPPTSFSKRWIGVGSVPKPGGNATTTRPVPRGRAGFGTCRQRASGGASAGGRRERRGRLPRRGGPGECAEGSEESGDAEGSAAGSASGTMVPPMRDAATRVTARPRGLTRRGPRSPPSRTRAWKLKPPIGPSRSRISPATKRPGTTRDAIVRGRPRRARRRRRSPRRSRSRASPRPGARSASAPGRARGVGLRGLPAARRGVRAARRARALGEPLGQRARAAQRVERRRGRRGDGRASRARARVLVGATSGSKSTSERRRRSTGAASVEPAATRPSAPGPERPVCVNSSGRRRSSERLPPSRRRRAARRPSAIPASSRTQGASTTSGASAGTRAASPCGRGAPSTGSRRRSCPSAGRTAPPPRRRRAAPPRRAVARAHGEARRRGARTARSPACDVAHARPGARRARRTSASATSRAPAARRARPSRGRLLARRHAEPRNVATTSAGESARNDGARKRSPARPEPARGVAGRRASW